MSFEVSLDRNTQSDRSTGESAESTSNLENLRGPRNDLIDATKAAALLRRSKDYVHKHGAELGSQHIERRVFFSRALVKEHINKVGVKPSSRTHFRLPAVRTELGLKPGCSISPERLKRLGGIQVDKVWYVPKEEVRRERALRRGEVPLPIINQRVLSDLVGAPRSTISTAVNTGELEGKRGVFGMTLSPQSVLNFTYNRYPERLPQVLNYLTKVLKLNPDGAELSKFKQLALVLKKYFWVDKAHSSWDVAKKLGYNTPFNFPAALYLHLGARKVGREWRFPNEIVDSEFERAALRRQLPPANSLEGFAKIVHSSRRRIRSLFQAEFPGYQTVSRVSAMSASMALRLAKTHFPEYRREIELSLSARCQFKGQAELQVRLGKAVTYMQHYQQIDRIMDTTISVLGSHRNGVATATLKAELALVEYVIAKQQKSRGSAQIDAKRANSWLIRRNILMGVLSLRDLERAE